MHSRLTRRIRVTWFALTALLASCGVRPETAMDEPIDRSVDTSEGGQLLDEGEIEAARLAAGWTWTPPLAGRTFLDSWGGTGVVTTPIGTADDVVRATQYQTDGKLVVVGRVHNGSYNEFLVARYLPDGSLDSSFDGDGFARIDFPGGEALAHGLAIDGNGRIVVAGRVWGFSNFDFGVARLNTDGSMDSTFFGSSGRRVIDFGGAEFARDVAVDSAGRIVVAGYSNAGGNFDVAIARLLSDGTLDPGFNVSGLQTTAIGTAWDIGYALAIDSANRPVVAGLSQSGGQHDFALVRYQTNGALDNAFSGDGRDTWAIGTGDDVGWSLAIGTNGQYYVGGRSRSGANYRMAVAIWGTDGSHLKSGTYGVATGAVARGMSLDEEGRMLLGGRSWNGANWDFAMLRIRDQEGFDTGFSTDGIAIASAGTRDDFAYAMARTTDGKLVVVGPTRNASNEDFAVMRFQTNGLLDSTFSGDGIAVTAIGTADDIPYGVALQGDGKILVGGMTRIGTRSVVAITRYTTAGALDNTWSGDGIALTSVGSGNAQANSILVQPDGKVVVGGTSYNGSNSDMFISRYSTAGALEPAFAGGGTRVITIGTRDDFGYFLARQTNGRIVIAGRALFASNYQFAAARVNSNGNLDNTFDGDGRMSMAIGTNADDSAYAVAILSDGKILLGGQTRATAGKDFAFARLLSTGAIDSTFSGDGRVTIPIHTDGASLHGMALYSDGRILGVGRTHELRNRFALARLSTGGTLDSTFDDDGLLLMDITTGDDIAYAPVIAPNGSAYVAGAGYSGSNFDFVIVGLGGFGLLDSAFNGSGVAVTAIGTSDDIGLSLAYEGGKTVLAGDSVRSGFFDLALVRYNSDGSLASSGAPDKTFSTDGVVTQPVGTADDIAYAVAVDSRSSVYVGGLTRNGATNDFAVAKFTSAGTLDTTFNATGLATTAIGTGNDSIGALAVQPDGKLLAVGQAFQGGTWDFALVRYTTNGALDSTFDGDGRVITSIGTADDIAQAAAVDGNGRIVVAGSSVAASRNRFALARYTTTGSLDNTFGSSGIVTTSFTTASTDDMAYAVAIQPDGKIVVGGHSHQSSGKFFALARYQTNGALDSTFGGGGLVLTSVDTDGADLYAMALETGGRIVAAGRSFGIADSIAMARYLTDGSLDNTFGTNGVATLSPSTGDDIGFGLALTGNGKAVVAGFSLRSGNPDISLVRALRNGAVDTSFGSGGTVFSSLTTRDDFAHAIALTRDGRLVVAGSTHNGTDHDFAVLRYWP